MQARRLILGGVLAMRRCRQSRRHLSTEVFDRELKKRQRAICLANDRDGGYYDYLRDESARQIADRLDDISRTFPLSLELGSYRGALFDLIQSGQSPLGKGGLGGIQHLVQCDPSFRPPSQTERDSTSPVTTSILQVDEEFLPFKNDTFDLVLSSLHLHWVNDLPATLRQIHSVLKPDGAFIASFLGGETLQELRHCFYLSELERRGGISPHCSPLLRSSDVAALIQAADFSMPTVDVETMTIGYPDAFSLMEHVWKMGEGAAAVNRSLHVGKETILAMAALYQQLYGLEDGSVRATFEVTFAIGWKPHESQPKACRRGSAATSMKDIGKLPRGSS